MSVTIGTGSAFSVLLPKVIEVSVTIGTGSAFPVLSSKAVEVSVTIGTGSAFFDLSSKAVEVSATIGTGSAFLAQIADKSISPDNSIDFCSEVRLDNNFSISKFSELLSDLSEAISIALFILIFPSITSC